MMSGSLKTKSQNLKIAYRIRQQIKYMIKLLEKKAIIIIGVI